MFVCVLGCVFKGMPKGMDTSYLCGLFLPTANPSWEDFTP